MPQKFTYLLIDFGCLIFPLLFSFHPKNQFYKEWRFFIVPSILVALFFILWDMLFTHLNVWNFNPDYLIGMYVFNLPIEEILFFLCIPYACVFSYFSFIKFITLKPSSHLFYKSVMAFALIMIGLSLFWYKHIYTSVTLCLLGIVLLFFAFKKYDFLKPFLITYLFILIPFFLSNGALTGAFTDEPIVSYNDKYNLGIRMITIPVEDTFYGLLMLILNVFGYHLLKNKQLHEV